MKIDERLRLTEKNRRELIAKSKASDNYKDMSKGRNRWERRTRSKVASTVADYNKLDMDAFWKGDILEFGIRIKGETADYTVQITFENVLDEIRKEIANNKNKLEFKCILKALIRVFNSENVYVHCTCKDFFYRQAYWSTKGKYNSGTPQYDNGKRIANPNDTKGAGCKHVNLVLSNVDWLMKIASVINNYIWYCKDNMELNYAKYIFPKLYGMDYDKAIQLTINDIDNPNSDSLTSDEATLNLSNALGRRRTQFKKLPQQSVNPRYQKPKQQQTNSKDRTLFDLDKEDNDLKNEALNESIISNKFKTETAGYILDDGSFVFVDEYHGDDPEYKNKQYPEFSNTHPEDDTCIRIYKEPNEAQYKQLEKIIDIYLDREGYCKIELWSSSEAYYFYKIFSLYENACADDTFEENIGNWNGYKLVQIIKNNLK